MQRWDCQRERRQTCWRSSARIRREHYLCRENHLQRGARVWSKSHRRRASRPGSLWWASYVSPLSGRAVVALPGSTAGLSSSAPPALALRQCGVVGLNPAAAAPVCSSVWSVPAWACLHCAPFIDFGIFRFCPHLCPADLPLARSSTANWTIRASSQKRRSVRNRTVKAEIHGRKLKGRGVQVVPGGDDGGCCQAERGEECKERHQPSGTLLREAGLREQLACTHQVMSSSTR